VNIDYKRWFKGAVEGIPAIKPEELDFEDAVRGISKSVQRLHNSLLGEKEKGLLKTLFTDA
jgi:hypothetical protein